MTHKITNLLHIILSIYTNNDLIWIATTLCLRLRNHGHYNQLNCCIIVYVEIKLYLCYVPYYLVDMKTLASLFIFYIKLC